ncbi:putative N-acetylmannosaminyltransferase [Fervidicola ferrireducens]|uniref:Putative N-acetylmannosaminyltransferase n=1 Tax=Fervidicola ferrireducens TaxID=520764 RepID=A0A140LCQ8_9FIRM|nr:WecB/TagA/CpsF family glycosyltransferase [Fervidicola ferrireducens]KXG78333.1 putative N-acetylmannosaminyltransferase [Fervidicola ferrireducens]
MEHRYILGMRVDATSFQEATRLILKWAGTGESRYVCAANVHMVMEAYDSPAFRKVVNNADLVVPDGMPLAYGLRLLGMRGQERVCGPELMLHVCEAAASQGVPVGFYGGSPDTLQALVKNLSKRFPNLRVAYQYSPPFRPLTAEEDAAVTKQIAASGARILFVGLGCPKQECWMAEHRGKIPAVMLGVGAAFDFHAGRIRQAPRWVQNIGMEWFFRLCMEPRRLWRRYFKHNPRFLILFALQLVGKRY